MEKKAFLLYKNYIKQVDMLSDEAAGRLFKAILHYVNGASPVGFEGEAAAEMCFSFISDQIDRDMDEWQKKAKARSENGKKGGRPPKAGEDEKSETAEKSEKYKECREYIEEQVCLKGDFYDEADLPIVEEMCEAAADILSSEEPYIKIGGKMRPAETVKSRFMDFDCENATYVLDRLKKTAGRVGNTRGYLLTAMYNSTFEAGASGIMDYRADFPP